MVDTSIGLYALKVKTEHGSWATMHYPLGTSAAVVIRAMQSMEDRYSLRMVKQGESGTGGWQEIKVVGEHLTFSQYHETDDDITTCRCYEAGVAAFDTTHWIDGRNFAHPDEFEDGFRSAYDRHHDL